MGRPQNKVHQLPLEHRLEVYGWLCDGVTYGEITRRLGAAGIESARLPGPNAYTATTRNDPDYARYRDARLDLERETQADRELAALINDGHGPETLADLALYDTLRSVRDIARGGFETTGQAQQAAAAIKALTQTLRDDVIESLKAEHAKEVSQYQSRIASLERELNQLLNPESGPLTAEEKIAAIRERLGVQ